MSERDMSSKVALMPFLHSEAKVPFEGVLLYRPRNRNLVPENDIRYKFFLYSSSLVPVTVRAMRKIIGEKSCSAYECLPE